MHSAINDWTLFRRASRVPVSSDTSDEIGNVMGTACAVFPPGRPELATSARISPVDTQVAAEQPAQPPAICSHESQAEPEPGRAILADCPDLSERGRRLGEMLCELNFCLLCRDLAALIMGYSGKRLTWWLDELSRFIDAGAIDAHQFWFGVDIARMDAGCGSFPNATQVSALVSKGANFICTVDLDDAEDVRLLFVLRSLGVKPETMPIYEFVDWVDSFEGGAVFGAPVKSFPASNTPALDSYFSLVPFERCIPDDASGPSSSDEELKFEEWLEKSELRDAYSNEFAMNRLYAERYRRTSLSRW